MKSIDALLRNIRWCCGFFGRGAPHEQVTVERSCGLLAASGHAGSLMLRWVVWTHIEAEAWRSALPIGRGDVLVAERLRSQAAVPGNLQLSRTSQRICRLTVLRFRVCVERFFQTPTCYLKSDLSTYVLWYIWCLMIYVLCLILCPMSYDLKALVYILFLGLRLTILWLVSVHSVSVDMSFLTHTYSIWATWHFWRILIPIEEAPHLTADWSP